jgi:hypothetical protein
MKILAASLSSLLAISPAIATTASAQQTRDQTSAQSQTSPQGQTPPQGQTTTKPGQAAAQTTEPPAPQIPISAESLNRIRDAINRPSRLRIENGQMRIHVEVIAKWPSFAEIAKGYDLMNGPTGTTKGLYGYGNPMSHNEFIGMMTPKEMYGSGGIQATELAVIGLVNYFGQKLVKKGIEEIRSARNEKEIAEIRARIDKELEILRNGGGGPE